MRICPPHFRFEGNRERAQELKAEALQFYNWCARQFEIGRLMSGNRSYDLLDGSRISIHSWKDEFDNRFGSISIYGAKNKEVVENTVPSFIWLASNNSSGKSGYYDAVPNSNLGKPTRMYWTGYSVNKVTPTSLKECIKKDFKFQTTYWGSNNRNDFSSGMEDDWKEPICWNNGKDVVTIGTVTLPNTTEFNKYINDPRFAGYPFEPTVHIRKFLYWKEPGVLSWDWNKATEQNVRCLYWKGKQYILPLFPHGYNRQVSHAASVIDGKVYVAFMNPIGTTPREVIVRKFTLVDIPKDSTNIYGTATFTETILKLPSDTSILDLIFSDTTPSLLYAKCRAASGGNDIPLKIQRYDLKKLDSNASGTTIYSGLDTETYLGTVVEFTCIKGLIGFRTNGQGMALDDSGKAISIPDIRPEVTYVNGMVTESTRYIVYFPQIRLFVYVYEPYQQHKSILEVSLNGRIIYSLTYPTSLQGIFYNGGDYSDYVNHASWCRNRSGSVARFGSRILVSTTRYSADQTALTTVPDIIEIDLKNNKVTPLPKSITGRVTEIFVVQ